MKQKRIWNLEKNTKNQKPKLQIQLLPEFREQENTIQRVRFPKKKKNLKERRSHPKLSFPLLCFLGSQIEKSREKIYLKAWMIHANPKADIPNSLQNATMELSSAVDAFYF